MNKKEELTLMEAHYREVEVAYPAAIQRLAREVGVEDFVVGDIVLAASSQDGVRFELLCELVGDDEQKIQISGNTVNEIPFGYSNARFDKESLRYEFVNFTCPGAEALKIEGGLEFVPMDRYMTLTRRPSGTWGINYAGHVDRECARISMTQYPDLYPGLTTIGEVAEKIALDFIRRQKAEIVTMVKNTWGE